MVTRISEADAARLGAFELEPPPAEKREVRMTWLERWEAVHVVVPGPTPPQPRPRATMVPLYKTAELLRRAAKAEKMAEVMKLFRPSVYGLPSKHPLNGWKLDVRNALRAAVPFDRDVLWMDEPLRVEIFVVTELPKSEARKTNPKGRAWQTSARQGDLDNLAKPILDVSTGVLWQDDRQLAAMFVQKVRGAQSEQGRLEMIARPIGEDPRATRFEQELSQLRR